MHKTHPGRQKEQTGCLWEIKSRSTLFHLMNMETQTHLLADVSLKDRVKMKESFKSKVYQYEGQRMTFSTRGKMSKFCLSSGQ